MEELLNKVSKIINKSNIPENIRPVVEAVARGYMRETEGKLPIEGIYNLCNAEYVEIDENDKNFATENNFFALTNKEYDEECNIKHKIEYVNSPDKTKLITILTHELGHVMTQYKPCEITEEGIYPLIKTTTAIYLQCVYDEYHDLLASKIFGVKMQEGFMETISEKVFNSDEFREELLSKGYNLGDITYKDESLFPSRVYDEFKACFQLYDYIMDGKLFDFSIMNFESNKELVKFINDSKLTNIFRLLDSSNEAIWKLKKYEGKEVDEKYSELLKDYKEKKKTSVNFAEELMNFYKKDIDDPKYKELLEIYEKTLDKQKLLPIHSKEFK